MKNFLKLSFSLIFSLGLINGLVALDDSENMDIKSPETRIITMKDAWTIDYWEVWDDGYDCDIYIYPSGRTWATGPDC